MGMSNLPLAWGDDAPETLEHHCAKTVASNPETICERFVDNGCWGLKQGVALPQEICEKLINIWQELGPHRLSDEFLAIFEDLSNTRLRRVNLKNSSVTDEGLRIILTHKLLELDISNCRKLTKVSFDNINLYGNDLISLILSKNIFKHLYDSKEEDPGSIIQKQGYVFNTPKLRRLVVRDCRISKDLNFYSTLLRPLKQLTYLDLSNCYFLDDLSYIKHLSHLITLILHNVENIQETIPAICKLSNLRILDVSQESIQNGMFESPDSVLEEIVLSLPKLDRLDISGTNLAGVGNFTLRNKGKSSSEEENSEELLCDIPGLQSRVKNPLDFLGLYNTYNDACNRYSIPARIITGEANEDQVLAATEAYLDRPLILVKALNELYHIFRYQNCRDHKRALNLILYAMMKHKSEKHIQISGSASLFYIAKDEEKTKLSFFAKRKMITVLLDAMDKYIEDTTMMRNGCLTICQFRIPQDIGFSYRRLVELLLKLVKLHIDNEDFVRKVAMYLINSLACQVDGQQKELVGDLGAIETMLGIINDRLTQRFHDDVLEIAWSAMWNVTDETPINCQRFLDEHGMKYFQRCLTEFPDKEELLRNMMGLLGNVAEVEYLRPRLVKPDLIETFANLLDSTSDGIEVSYNAAGVLSHIASDGPEAWTIEYPSREYVLRKMVSAIERWDLNSKRNINYRSFEPS
ncbi:Protein zer-1-like protein [Armadillidium vulgare]|nr:Protein zer-1-like protein [Armadillidium vulgare]